MIFFQWDGWTAISSICQVLITLAAFWAVLITLRQIGNRKKVSLDIDFTLKIVNRSKDDKTKIIATVLEIWNYGLSPIFIKSCWFGFEKNLKRTSPNALVVPIERTFINPGEYKIFATGLNRFILSELGQRVKRSGKLYVYIENGVGTTKRVPFKTDFSKFLLEYNELCISLGEKQMQFK